MKPFFSIVIPTYNRSDTIVETLHSVFGQSYPDFEVIVVDDGSTDNTQSLIEQTFPEKKNLFYYYKQNEERGAARNFGAQKSKGNYINFFDSDDLMLPNHLSVAAELILEKNNPELVALNYFIQHPTKKQAIDLTQYPDLRHALIAGNHLSCNPVFVRADIIRALPFNEDREMAAFEDWELWLRMAARYPIHVSPEFTSTLINHEGRSVNTANKEKLARKAERIQHYLKQDLPFIEFYSKNLNVFKSSIYSYISLHLALSGNERISTLRYFFQAWWLNPAFIAQRRFWGIIKHWF